MSNIESNIILLSIVVVIILYCRKNHMQNKTIVRIENLVHATAKNEQSFMQLITSLKSNYDFGSNIYSLEQAIKDARSHVLVKWNGFTILFSSNIIEYSLLRCFNITRLDIRSTKLEKKSERYNKLKAYFNVHPDYVDFNNKEIDIAIFVAYSFVYKEVIK